MEAYVVRIDETQEYLIERRHGWGNTKDLNKAAIYTSELNANRAIKSRYTYKLHPPKCSILKIRLELV